MKAASLANAAAVNPNRIETLLAIGLSTFFIKDNPAFSNGPKCPPKNSPDYPILCNWVFDKFVLADEPFAKAAGSFVTCILINSNLCEKLFSSIVSTTTFDKTFKIASVAFFIPDFNLI